MKDVHVYSLCPAGFLIDSLYALYFYCSHKLADAKTRKVMGRDEFRLLHYAGEVNYNVNGESVCVFLSFYSCMDQPLTDSLCCEDICTCEDILAGPPKIYC